MTSQNSTQIQIYVGRFAPSPTGPLHFGSLLAAVASHLDAKAHGGRWLVRMEDLDPPREPAGAADQILEQLQALELHWDDEVLYQSDRLTNYQRTLEQLQTANLCFHCDCTRTRIKNLKSVYDGHCRNRSLSTEADCSVRVLSKNKEIEFTDLVQGCVKQNIEAEVGDFVILRKDKLFAYQLAVVIDDAYQQISHIIRGNDLISSTPRQIYLQQLLNLPTPIYGHIPVIVNDKGQKLSKQHFATPVELSNGPRLVHSSLKCLGLLPPSTHKTAAISEQLAWGVEHWDIQRVPKLATIPENTLDID